MKFEFKQRVISYGVFILLFILFVPIFMHRSHPVNLPIESAATPIKSASKMAKSGNPVTQATSIHFKIHSIHSNAKPNTGRTSAMVTSVSSPVKPLKKNRPKATMESSKISPLVKQNKQQSTPVVVHNKKNRSQVRQAQRRWLVQLGTFSHDKNANRLLQTLKKKGYKGFSSRVKFKNGRHVTLVFAGPAAKLSDATELQKLILKKMRLKGVIKYSKS